MNSSKKRQYDPQDIELPKCGLTDLPSPNVIKKIDRNGGERNI